MSSRSIPLAKCDFGDKLKEHLATPVAYYRLKTACGPSKYLPDRPLEKSFPDMVRIYVGKYGMKIYINGKLLDNEPKGNELIVLNGYTGAQLELRRLKVKDFERNVFNHIYLAPAVLLFELCRIDNAFLELVARDNTRNVRKIVDIDSNVSKDVTLQGLLKLFPSLTDSTLKVPVKAGWISEFLLTDKRDMNQFQVCGSIEDVFSFGWDEFTQFFERQDTVFKLHLLVPQPPRKFKILDQFPDDDFMLQSKSDDGMKISYTGIENLFGSVNIHYSNVTKKINVPYPF